MVPDEAFDELMADLSGSEWKVLSYIIRRTFGFKKQSDDISLSQIANGITTAGGRRLDHGTGLSKPSVIAAVKVLVERNIVLAEHRSSAEKGHEPTRYRLNVVDPLVKKVDKGSLEEIDPSQKSLQGASKTVLQALVRKHDKQETVKQETEHVHEQQHMHVNPTPQALEDVVVALTKLGVTKRIARQLVRQHSEPEIRAQISMLPYRPADDPTAVLVKAIREEWAPPAAYQTPEQRETEAREAKRIEAELEAWRQAQMVSRETEDAAGTQPRRQAVEFRPFQATALDSRRVWATAVLDLKSHDGADAYLRGTRLLAREGDELVVGAGTAYAAEWLQRRIAHRAAQLLSAIGGEQVTMRFVGEAEWLSLRQEEFN
ncbi:MAG TPA: replication protein [Herpetosiphonaceae bacterium]|nr:replication protein [Herpetosiphonaceae bacterium]